MCRACLILLTLCTTADVTLAVSIHYGGTGATMPIRLEHQDVANPLDVILQMANFSESTATVLAWQLDLEVRPVAGAPGNLLIHEIAPPPDGLFGEGSAPLSDPPLPPPAKRVFVQDVSPNFTGVPLPPNTARNILLVRLHATPDAAGEFQLVTPAASDPQSDSSWMDDDFTPHFFDNAAPSAFPGFILLASIQVGQPAAFAAGDYNRDGNVSAADYARWRLDFGSIADPPGSAADGNRDGIVDAADYVLWRRNYAPVGGEIAPAAVPEPTNFIAASLALAPVLLLSRKLLPLRGGVGHAEPDLWCSDGFQPAAGKTRMIQVRKHAELPWHRLPSSIN